MWVEEELGPKRTAPDHMAYKMFFNNNAKHTRQSIKQIRNKVTNKTLARLSK